MVRRDRCASLRRAVTPDIFIVFVYWFLMEIFGDPIRYNLKRKRDDVKDFFIVVIVDTTLTFATSEKKKEK